MKNGEKETIFKMENENKEDKYRDDGKTMKMAEWNRIKHVDKNMR